MMLKPRFGHNVTIRYYSTSRHGTRFMSRTPSSMYFIKLIYIQPFLAKFHVTTDVRRNSRLSMYITRYLQQNYFSTSTSFSARKYGPPPPGDDSHTSFRMKKSIKDPKFIIKSLLDPLIRSGDTVEPMMILTPNYAEGVWKARLHIHWPSTINFTGIHASVAKAEEEAYFKACEEFQNIGLIHEINGQVRPIDEEKVFTVLHTMYEKGTHIGSDAGSKHNFRLSTTKTARDNEILWKSEINVPWPFSFSVSSTGYSFHSTQYMACLMAYTRFKMLGLLNERNNLSTHKIPSIRKNKASDDVKEMTREEFGPEYEVYVDASKCGLGAYLLTRDDDGKIHWMSESWPEHFPPSDFNDDLSLKFDTAFCEYYALVTAVYTWKHKFINKKVLCWSDNMSAVDFTNHGPRLGDKTLQKYGKLYQIMIQTIAKYNIDLRAFHVKRVDNQKADLLSKLRITEFKKLVPGADLMNKKSKKLLFWKPLIEIESKPDNKKPTKPGPEENK